MFRVTHEGIQIEASDALSVVALVRALKGQPVATPPVVVRQAALSAKPSTRRMAKVATTTPHARSHEGREMVAARRARIRVALQSGEQHAHELLSRPDMSDYPKTALFNDLSALERAGEIARGERGYFLVEPMRSADPLASTPSEAASHGWPS